MLRVPTDVSYVPCPRTAVSLFELSVFLRTPAERGGGGVRWRLGGQGREEGGQHARAPFDLPLLLFSFSLFKNK